MRVSLLVFLLLTACAASHPVAPVAQTSPLVAPGQAHLGDRTSCLVSGEEFTVTDASPKVAYGGTTYYFCCAGCDRDFAADPERFLRKTDAGVSTAVTSVSPGS